MSGKIQWRMLLHGRWFRYGLMLLGALLLYQVSGLQVLGNLRDVWRQEAEMQRQIEALREENARIENEIRDLSPEGNEVERIARQDLGWARPGETVIKIPEKK